MKIFQKLLFVSFLSWTAVFTAWSDTVTEGFDDYNCSWSSGWVWTVSLPTGWDSYGDNTVLQLGNESGDYHSSVPSVAIPSTNTATYLITPELKGQFNFWLKNQTKNYQASVSAYACTYVDGVLTLGALIGSKTLAKVSSRPSFENVSFNTVSGTRVALLISRAYLDDFTYTPNVVKDGASLEVTDYVSGSTFDFGTVAAGAAKTFTLLNAGTQTLTINSVSVDGGFVITEGKDISTIEAGQYATVTVATPAADASGVLTIASNDANSPYTIRLSSTYKVPVPVMVVNPLVVDFGKVTANASQTVAVSNTGDGELVATVASDNSEFTVSPANLTVAAGQSATFTITYQYQPEAYGKHMAGITVTPNVGDAVYVNAYAKIINPNAWTEDFSGNALPYGWATDENWTFSDGVAHAKYVYGSAKYYLTTPALQVVEGDELTFLYKATGNYVNINVEASKDGGDFIGCKLIDNLSVMSEFEEATISNLEPGSYRFRFVNDNYDLDNFEGFKLDMNAPQLSVTPTEDADFGDRIKSQPVSKAYIIANTGTGVLKGTIASSSPSFTVSESEFSLKAGERMAFDIYLVFDANYGEKSAVITIHPTNAGLADVTINATGTTVDPNVWQENFTQGIPDNWTNNGFTNDHFDHQGEAYAGYNGGTLVTPRLQATAGATLSFDITAADGTDKLTVEWGNSRDGEYTLIGEFDATGSQTFTAPADGFYFLRFSGRFVGVDNFFGFKEAPLAHDAFIASCNIASVGHQYAEYVATVTVEEKAGNAEELTARFFIGNAQYGEDIAETVEAYGTKTFTVRFTPAEALSGDAFFTVSGTDISLTTEPRPVEILAAPVWSENATTNPFSEGNYPVAVLDYQAAEGYNTVALPFAVNDLSIFGTGVKAYELDSYTDGTLNFKQVYSLVNFTPYIIYVETPAEDLVKFFDIQITASAANADNCSTVRNGATFQGVYAVDTAEGKQLISQANAALTIGSAGDELKAFRAYMVLPEGVTQAQVSIDGVATGIRFVRQADSFDQKAYTVSGQQVNRPVKGLVIKNGRKVIIK